MENYNQLTSNQYYGGLNNRFDKRANKLRRAGWTYTRIVEFNLAVFTRKLYGRVRTIPAMALMHTNKTEWLTILTNNLLHSNLTRWQDQRKIA